MSGMKKLGLIAGGVLLVLVIAVVLIYVNLSSLTRGIVEKEVPNLTFSKLDVGWNTVRLTGVRYTAKSGKLLLKTESIRIQPSLMSFFSDTFRIASVKIEKPYVYIVRRRDGEIILPIPQPASDTADEAAAKKAPEEGAFAVYVGEVEIEDGSGEFVDRSVGKPYARFKITDVDIEVKGLSYPQTSSRIPATISMVIEGPREGRFRLAGWFDPVTDSGDLDVAVSGLFIPHAEPYYRSKYTTAKLSDGTLDLKLGLKMKNGAVVLPGEITMAKLKFNTDRGKFFGVPASAVGKYFTEQRKPLTIPFEVEGHIDRPDEIRIKVISVIVKRMLAKLGAQEVGAVADKLKEGDVEGAEEEAKKIKRKFKGLFK